MPHNPLMDESVDKEILGQEYRRMAGGQPKVEQQDISWPRNVFAHGPTPIPQKARRQPGDGMMEMPIRRVGFRLMPRLQQTHPFRHPEDKPDTVCPKATRLSVDIGHAFPGQRFRNNRLSQEFHARYSPEELPMILGSTSGLPSGAAGRGGKGRLRRVFSNTLSIPGT